MPVPSEQKLRATYDKHGGNFTKIARSLGRPLNTVKSWYYNRGYKGRGKGGTPRTAPPDEELRGLHAQYSGNHQRVADHLGVGRSSVVVWMRRLGLRGEGREKYSWTYPRELKIDIPNGSVVAFSDAHWWEEEKSPAHEALLRVIKKSKPDVVIANGDLVDASRVSRHDPTGLQESPRLTDELRVCQQHLAEIKRLSGADGYYNWGNHEVRVPKHLAIDAPEFGEMDELRLENIFLGWKFAWSNRINDALLVMHRYKGGQHATYTSLLRAGLSIAFGHLHSQRVYPFTNANGTIWGTDLGCLAAPLGPQFAYAEAAPLDWRAGFARFTFKNRRLLPPELVTVLDDGSVCWQRNEFVLQ